MGALNPEELIVVADTAGAPALHLLTDDGTDECKSAAPAARSFRAVAVQLQV